MHADKEKTKLLARVRRIKGQVEALERALEAEVESEKILHLIAAARGGIAGLMGEVVEHHGVLGITVQIVTISKYLKP